MEIIYYTIDGILNDEQTNTHTYIHIQYSYPLNWENSDWEALLLSIISYSTYFLSLCSLLSLCLFRSNLSALPRKKLCLILTWKENIYFFCIDWSSHRRVKMKNNMSKYWFIYLNRKYFRIKKWVDIFPSTWTIVNKGWKAKKSNQFTRYQLHGFYW